MLYNSEKFKFLVFLNFLSSKLSSDFNCFFVENHQPQSPNILSLNPLLKFNSICDFPLTSNGYNIYLMHINDDMTINSTEAVLITNYFNVNLIPSITLTIYVNNTLYLASKRIYYFNSNSYNYITIISKSNTLFQNDE